MPMPESAGPPEPPRPVESATDQRDAPAEDGETPHDDSASADPTPGDTDTGVRPAFTQHYPVVPARPSRLSRKGWWITGGVGVLLVAGLSAVPAIHTGPEDVVEDFFTALQDKDVESALDQVSRIGFGVPYGTAAAFLHPDAIADGWELVDVTAGGEGEYSSEQLVDVTLSVGGETETGSVTVTEFNDEWGLVDPFIAVEFGPTPTDFLRVNDRTVMPLEVHAANVTGVAVGNVYKIFPGPTSFFADLTGTTTEPEPSQTLWPAADMSYYGDMTVAVPTLEFTDEVQAQAQRSVDRILDDCARFRVNTPANCPFRFDDFHWEQDADIAIDDPYDVTWSIESYPRMTLVDPGGDERTGGLTFDVAEAGVVTFAASGREDGDPVEVEADCSVDVSNMYAALKSDGSVQALVIGFDPAMPLFIITPEDTCTITDVTRE